MLSKLQAALKRTLQRLEGQDRALAKARRRYRKFHLRAVDNHRKQKKREKAADDARAKGETDEADRLDRRAGRAKHRAYRSHLKAQFWRGRVKELAAKANGLDQRADQIENEISDWKKKHGVTVTGNKVSGGTPEQRWRAACLTSVKNCSTGHRRNFYDQAGAWDVQHELTPGPSYDERSDCSQWLTGMAWSAGLPDPNGEDFKAGFTGTLVGEHNGWKQVSRTQMEKIGWGYVVYGSGVGHHVEAYIGPGDRTAGHGSPPVDFGVIDLFGDGDYRCFILKSKGKS